MKDLDPLYLDLSRCTACELSALCRAPVPGEGRPSSVVIFGRNPGSTEDEEGRPFVGPGGRRLFGFLSTLGLARSGFYITNLVKCYTQADAPPKDHQISTCSRWWIEELTAICPHLVIALGNQAYSFLAGQNLSVVKDRRHVRTWTSGNLTFRYVGVVHPGSAVRNGKMAIIMEEDLRWALMELVPIGEPIKGE